MSDIGFIIFGVVVLSACAIWYYGFERPREKMKEKEDARLEKKKVEKRVRWKRWDTAHTIFDVDVDPPYESQAYDEIVRVVNLLAQLTAKACVAQDEFVRNEGVVLHHNTDWDSEVRNRKREWSQKRSFALEICPELASRLPHFSEFEPLKSYREEHLREKADKKSAT